MQSPEALQPDPWRAAAAPLPHPSPSASGLPPAPPLSSVVSPSSAYGFSGQMPSPAASHAGDDDGESEAKRRTNPLIDLIESEKRYVEELSMVIRKVAGAWSRQNFPPPLLDLMFRSIEGVYKINRSFGAKLREIGPSPSSPKALGDLLMRWIDDMEPAYRRYCTTYLTSYDTWTPVQSNTALHAILSDVSAQLQAAPSSPLHDGKWTLDSFFILPYQRLRYYKKLYARLLKSTQPGRSDHNLLIGANERLDALLELVRSRLEMTVEDEGNPSAFRPLQQGERTSTISSTAHSRSSDASMFSQNGRDSSNSTSTSYNSLSPPTMQPIHNEKEPLPRDLEQSPPPPPVPRETLADVERRLAPDRTMDLFTMKPRMVRLQINPSSLPFVRQLRCSAAVEISFTPTSLGRPVVHRKAHIFLLSDLFLMCEYMDEKDRLQKAAESANGQRQDLWLSYPPLAGKHLQAQPGPTPNSIEVLVMKKERFLIQLASPELQSPILRDFSACIQFATDMQQQISQRAAAGLPPTSPEPSIARSSPAPSITSPIATSPQQSFPPAPLQKQHPGQQRVVSQAPSQASTYSTHSSSGSPSINQQMDAMSLQSHQSGPPPAQYPPAGAPHYNGGRPQSPPQYGQHNGAPPATMPPPRGASLGHMNAPRPSPPGPAQFNQFPVRSISGGLSPAPPQHAPQPYLQPGQQLRPGQPLGPPYPQGQGGAVRPPFPPGPNMPPQGSVSRSQSMLSNGSQASSYLQPEAPLPPPPMMRGGPPDRLSPQSYLPPGSSIPAGGAIRSNSDGGPPSSGPSHPALRPSPSASQLGQRESSAPVNFAADPGSQRPRSAEPIAPVAMPSAAFAEVRQRAISSLDPSSGTSTPPEEVTDLSPPPSPTAEQDRATLSGPAIITAQMKCKVFLKRNHAQWKSIGAARLKLYHQQSTNVKQLVVESDSSSKAMLISTIVLTDGVERVGKTGVAIEISDQGRRTGVIYMIQLRNEQSAGGLYDSLLAGTNRGK